MDTPSHRADVQRFHARRRERARRPAPAREGPATVDVMQPRPGSGLLVLENECVSRGRSYDSRRAYVKEDAAVGYFTFTHESAGIGVMTTWHGEVIGSARVTARWKVTPPAWPNAREIYQVEAVIQGRRFVGRTNDGRLRRSQDGNGRYWRGRRSTPLRPPSQAAFL
jgi:hypothetical protein